MWFDVDNPKPADMKSTQNFGREKVQDDAKSERETASKAPGTTKWLPQKAHEPLPSPEDSFGCNP